MIIDNKQKIKILIPRFDTLGDLVLLEGFIEQLRSIFPSAEILMLVRSGYEQVLTLFPLSISLKWLSLDGYPYHSPSEHELIAFKHQLIPLLSESWDLLLFTAFNRNWMDVATASVFKETCKVFIGAPGSIENLIDNKDVFVPVEERIHETKKYEILLSTLTGKQVLLSPPRLEINDNVTKGVDELLFDLGLSKCDYVACVPAGVQNQSGKIWPLDRFCDILTWVSSEHKLHPLLLGHYTEADIVYSLSDMLHAKGVLPRIWLGGEGQIPLLAGLTKYARFYLGNDTGPMHIAAAMGVPTIGIFGGGTFPRFLPTGALSIGLAGELPCFGCLWNCKFNDPVCMRVVNVDDVKEAICLILKSQKLDGNYFPVLSGCYERIEEFILKTVEWSLRQEKTKNIEPLDNFNCDLEKTVLSLEKRLSAIESSMSWIITKPLRIVGNWVKNCMK